MSTLPAVGEPIAVCRAIDVTFGSGESAVRALAGIDVVIRAHERVALLGRSGSGKTTLLHLLGGLVEPAHGTVDWRGVSLSSLDQAARGAVRASGIAYVFQGANLLPYFTAYENVAFAALVAENDVATETAPAAWLDLVGLAAKADHLPADLSGGEAQRVAIARALAQSPHLLLCDEPTGHLDSDSSERVLNLIDALQAEFGFALVVAAHSSDVAARFSRQIELDDGVIIRDETE